MPAPFKTHKKLTSGYSLLLSEPETVVESEQQLLQKEKIEKLKKILEDPIFRA